MEKQADKTKSATGASQSARSLFFRDTMYAKLIAALLVVVWLFGGTWTSWPGWMMLGMFVSFMLRAGTEGHFPWMVSAQRFMDKLLGEWGVKQHQRLEKWLEKKGVFAPLKKSNPGEESVKVAPKPSSGSSAKKPASKPKTPSKS